MLKKLILASLVLVGFHASAQNSGYCGTPTAETQILSRTDITEEEKTKLLNDYQLYQDAIQKSADINYNDRDNKDEATYVIPVVFHVFHNYGVENISVEQIYDQIRVMNEEFQKRSPKLAEVIPEFQPIIADIKLEFRLAKRDPNGNCTNGINRYAVANPYYTSQTPINALKKTHRWPTNRYMNCYIVGSIASEGGSRTLGFAQFPGFGDPDTDGLVMVHDGIGSIGTGSPDRQSVSTHEVGHWLGLRHTWGDCGEPGLATNCQCAGGDGIGDTPNTKGSPSVCNLQESSCGILANVQNFMDYSFCYAMFTEGQKARMRAVIESPTSGRNNLWSASNLIVTGANYTTEPTTLCKADFLKTSDNVLCPGNTVSYQDYSFNSVTSYNWEFEGGTPATSTEKNPTVTYNTPGIFKTTLTVSNGIDTKSVTKDSIVTILAKDALGSAYKQTFESATALSELNFTVNNPDKDRTWVIKSGVGVDGSSKSAHIQNTSIAEEGRIDELLSSTLDLTKLDTPYFSFDYAYAAKDNDSKDELSIQFSTDCGVTWTQSRLLRGTTLETAANITTAFTPKSASEWDNYKFTIPVGSRKDGFRFKLVWKNGNGNNVYIDNINVQSASTGVGIKENRVDLFALNIYPNPMDDAAAVSFTTPKFADVKIELFDIVGKRANVVYSGALGAGDHEYPINKGNLHSGVYFVKLTVDNNTFTRKVIIK